MQLTPYSWLMVAGIVLSLWFWKRNAPRRRGTGVIYFAALAGAFFGAKIVYFAAEGWLHWNEPNRWLILATGKTIVGALLGGYLAVEIAKRAVGYTEATGDFFATIAPISIVLGRIGCLLHGCCLGTICEPSWFSLRDASGVARWPAVPAEIAFNLTAIYIFSSLRRNRVLAGQHFHLYLIGYGVFRFLHEFARETPKVLGPFSGYHIAALILIGLGVVRFIQRQCSQISRIPIEGPIAQHHASANARIEC